MMKKTNGFEKPNHTQTPNSFFDEIMRDIDTMAELKVTLAIIRQTIGWHRKRTRYGIGKIQRLTGLARNSVITGAEAAEARGTIKRIPTDGEAEWELVIDDTPSNFEGANFEGGADVEGDPPQSLTKNPSNLEGLKRNKEIKKKEDAPDFSNMTMAQALKVPTLKLFRDAAGWFPADVLWEQVHTFILENSLTHEQIKTATVAWVGRGYNRRNVMGILEWAKNGIPSNGHKPETAIPAINEASVQKTMKEIEEKWNFKPALPPAERPRIGKPNA